MLKPEVGDRATIDGCKFVCAEVFRALGTNWVRYVLPQDFNVDVYVESRYATQAEWNAFRGIVP
jgi:hypothetical protein